MAVSVTESQIAEALRAAGCRSKSFSLATIDATKDSARQDGSSVVHWTLDPATLDAHSRSRSLEPGAVGFLSFQGEHMFGWGPITEPDEFLAELRWNAAYRAAQSDTERERVGKGAHQAGVALLDVEASQVHAQEELRTKVAAEVAAAGLRSVEFTGALPAGTKALPFLSEAMQVAVKVMQACKQDGMGTVRWTVDPQAIEAFPGSAGKHATVLLFRDEDYFVFTNLKEGKGLTHLRSVLARSTPTATECGACHGPAFGESETGLHCHKCGELVCQDCMRSLQHAQHIRILAAGGDAGTSGSGQVASPPMLELRCPRAGCGAVLGLSAVRLEGCARCGAADAHLLACGACRRIKYCSATCQKADWKTHKPLCVELRQGLHSTPAHNT